MSRTNGPRVARDTVVTLEYTLTAAGEKMDASPEGEPDGEAGTYVDMMRYNAATISEALG